MRQVFTHEDIARLERAHPDGVSAATVVALLEQRGVQIAEATFRKYVQLGLLPRSRRVGRKGKHRGSHGLYPVACVRRIAEIKSLMESGLTLEDIQRSAVTVGLEVDALRRTATGILFRLEAELEVRDVVRRATVARRLDALRTQADDLARRLDEATREIFRAPEMNDLVRPVSGRKTLDGPARAAAARTAGAVGRHKRPTAAGGRR